MENSRKKTGSSDIKSFYESRFSKVGGSKRKVSYGNDEEDDMKKKRKTRTEVPLSSYESCAKKSRKDDRNGAKSELGCKEKSDSRCKGLHGISLALGDNGSSFNIPKRPRDTVRRKKLESDQSSESLRHSNSVARVGALKADVIKSEDKGGPTDQLVRSVTLSTSNDGVSNTRLAGKVVASNKKSKSKSTMNSGSSNVKLKKVGADEPVDRMGTLKAEVTISKDNDDVPSSRLAGKVIGANPNLKQKADSKSTVNSSSSNVKLKQKVETDEVKWKRNSRSDSDRRVVKESDLDVSNGDASLRKQRTNIRKKKDLVVGKDGVQASIRKSEPAVGSSVSNSPFIDSLDDDGDDDDDDDDEENLERNAARMLSSRFDPSCTGFSSKKRSSVSQKTDELSFPVCSTRDLISRRAKSLNDGESASGDDSSRALRPRGGDKGKGVTKTRRHFYEVSGGDLDPYWVLKKRIKIFWPLDDSWYDGLVNYYQSDSKLHHIKYDDRDEEWVNLEEEKFKLLLHRSEVPGRAKSRKQFTRDKDSHVGQTVAPADDDSSMGNSHDSEPIGSWLACQCQRVKPLPNSSKRKAVSSPSSEKIDISNSVDYSNISRSKPGCKSSSADNFRVCGTIDKTLLGVALLSQTARESNVVYVRKKYQKRSSGSSSVCRDAKAFGSVGSNKRMWLFADKGKLTLNDALGESKEFRLQICLPVLSFPEFPRGVGFFWLLRAMYMLGHGVVMATSPAVILEMLFIDSNLGLRFLSYEGCLKQALAIVLQILAVFSQSDEHWNDDKKSPVTSIRFQISSVRDRRKQLVFALYSFSRLESSNWFYLESKILQQCLLIKQLPLSECSYGSIKELDCGNYKPRVGLELPSSEEFKKKFKLGVLPRGSLSFSTAPDFFFDLHLQFLMEHSISGANLQHQDAMCSQEASKTGQSAVQNITTEHGIRQLDSEAPAVGCFSSYRHTDGFVINSNPSESKSSSKRGRSSTISSPLGINSHLPPDGKLNFVPNGFSNGPKKPRTQVQYTLPSVDYDFSRKQEMPGSRTLPCKRIRRASQKRISDGSGNNQKNLELLTCFANVLVTHGDKGWRESGAHIVSEFADHNEWRLAIKLSGVTKFSYKVTHILQPGSTNRYSHAVIWKGGKDWVLEFPDRSQWTLFKELYEECYNRNIRAASVKNIPIPGVRLVEDSDYFGDDVPFVRNSTMYFRQVQTDAEMAMDPSNILYDMDSDDEQWLIAHKSCTDKLKSEELSEEYFEMAMDMFEKVSYAQRRDKFTDAEIKELVIGIGSVEAAKLIYQHWEQKREKMRMPLIRQLQPPPWERYQRQLKEWEQNVARGNYALSVGSQEKFPPEKPPMFAFCLKPRGLEVPNINKGSKQRSHRKLPVSGYHHAFSGDRDSPLVFGKRRDEKMLYASGIHGSFNVSPSLHPSSSVLSPQDAHFSLSTEWKSNRRIHKNKFKKLQSDPYFHSQQVLMMPDNHRTTGDKSGTTPWNLKHLDISSLDEYQLRDALAAVKRARKVAKLKREMAHSLHCKADVAIQKAATALMNAEAMKAAYENSNGAN